MDSPAASSAPAAPHELSFVLRVQPARLESPWHAELISPDGTTSAFGTPIDLIRHLAGLVTTVHRPTGLR